MTVDEALTHLQRETDVYLALLHSYDDKWGVHLIHAKNRIVTAACLLNGARSRHDDGGVSWLDVTTPPDPGDPK